MPPRICYPLLLFAALIFTLARAEDSRYSSNSNAKGTDNHDARQNSTSHASYEATSPTMIDAVFGSTSNLAQAAVQRQEGTSIQDSYQGAHNAAAMRPVALGAEGREQRAPGADLGPPQVLVADGTAILPGEVILQSPSMAYADSQMAMMSNNYQASPQQQMQQMQQPSQQQQQVLASLYIDQFGNQQLRLPQYEQAAQMSGGQPPAVNQMGSASDPTQNFYEAQYGPASPPIMAGPHVQRYRPVKHTEAPEKRLRLAQGLSFSSGSTNKAASLSNAQLMSLIDELKEFNSKQATNLRAKDVPASQQSSDDQSASADDENDSDMDPESEDTQNTASVAEGENGGAARGENHSQQAKPVRKKSAKKRKKPATNELNTDDLAKFARFLMTKEGANMRFQLGLEKDAPDDGDSDEDDRDQLLESKRKQSKTRAANGNGKINSSKELNELDQRHTEVADQMDKLLESLTGTLNAAADAKKKKNKKRQQPMEERDDERLKRARRDKNVGTDSADYPKQLRDGKIRTHVVSETTKQVLDEERRPKLAPLREKGHEDNFAKQLIEQELMQDKLESRLRSIPQHQSDAAPEMSQDGEAHQALASVKRRSDVARPRKARRTTQDDTHISGGNEEEPYPRSARDRDRVALMRELGKSRAIKSQMRSGSFGPRDPIVRQALDGGIGMQAESYPNGNLVLKSARGPSMTLRLPTKGDKLTRVSHATMNADDGGGASASPRNQGDGEVDDRGSLKSVRLGSEEPLKDEYPISEKVSKGLNALSNNLDRYFNDGFMNEIEGKSRVASPKAVNDKPASSERQQASSSDINESATSKDTKVDPDFDVNVGIDGKREQVDKDEEDDYDQDEDADPKAAGDKEAKGVPVKAKGGPVEAKKERLKSGKRGKRSKGLRNALERGPSLDVVAKGSSEAKKQPPNGKIGEDELVGGGNMKQNLSAGDEHFSFETNDGPVPGSADPVEGEAFDTPIGPDGDNLELHVPPSADKKVASSRESRNLVTRHGKRVLAPKFYEEPEWRA